MKSGDGEFSCKVKKKPRGPQVDVTASHRACSRCKVVKPASDFFSRNCSGYTLCSECRAASRTLSQERARAARVVRLRRIKMEVIKAYDGCCRCCGETNPEFLTIDHAFGRNHEMYRRDRARSKAQGAIWEFLKKIGCPQDRYRVLCFNCNSALGNFGYCPHGKNQERPLTQYGLPPRRDFENLPTRRKGRKRRKRA